MVTSVVGALDGLKCCSSLLSCVVIPLLRRWTTSRPVAEEEERGVDQSMMIPMTMHQSSGLPPPHRQQGLRVARVGSMAEVAGPSTGGVMSPPGVKLIGSGSAQDLSELADVDVDQSRP